ncbi:anti-sigma F factor antagonist (spoIIAA-2) [Indibacter alkaliphilus LW1]|jgi:anti-sigma B factor antagonist|uniref:Anti-sigma factor antagonist n=1 Tax=Indibacter alkaliphilus (strain CCUG 57479 / KCTC 22604 / LW1) TaxID=1189612 RepID=S2D584_INDAL|nr:STAS domain-containing protein [Indibacter alkaliphilus]EOZ92230.1 anti-sigma F factor antagonist (spoIIAA-2) [Indibacter alkaliphilus LW1]
MLDIKNIKEANYSTLQLEGEVDASNSVELDGAIQSVLDEGIDRILVDARQLDYISSAGLGVFMSYLEEFQEKNIKLVIYGLQEKVYQVFVILGLDKLMAIKSSEEEAIEELK